MPLLAISIFLLGFVPLATAQSCWFAGPRVDCGFVGIDQGQCKQRGCCWAPAAFQGAPQYDLPWCFTPNDVPSTYAVAKSESSGGPLDAVLAQQQGTMTELGADVSQLHATAREVAPGILRVRITDANAQRWEIPPWLYPAESIAGGGAGYRPSASNDDHGEASELQTEWNVSPFSLRVTRCSDSTSSATSLFDSTSLRLIFKPQYIELSTWISPSIILYGAGQRASATLHLRRNGAPRPLWARDVGPTFLESNSYGSHPFVLALEPENGTSFGLYMHNSNAMEIVPAPDRLSWRLTGGVVDLFILAGPTPAAVLDQLTRVVGRPAMPPFWALGWQASRYGWRSLAEVEGVVSNYSAAGIPLEAVYFDIDHMDRWKDFTFDPEKYPLPAVQSFVATLNKKAQKWIPIVDPGIKVEPGYEPYETGKKTAAVFVSGADGSGPYLGWVWPGPTHFPDFLSPAGRAFFEGELKKLHGEVPWHGLWIDMNEASSFCTGDVCEMPPSGDSSTTQNPEPWECQLDCSRDLRPSLNTTQRALLDPPFKIANSLSQNQPLNFKTLSVLATHSAGASETDELSTILQYDAHNLYGLAESRTVAAAAAAATGKRPFVLTRSSFMGTGSSAASWTGDNDATWGDLSRSIPGILSFGLVGIPFAGVDVCGFHGVAQEEMCGRWVATAALSYPFARSHNALEAPPQEPYLWDSVAAAARRTLHLRYSLLPYWYTAFRVAAEAGTPVTRPLWFNFPADKATNTIDSQVMVGDAMLVAPVLSPSAAAVRVYFPGGQTWYDAWEEADPVDASAGAVEKEIPLPADAAPVYLAGGSILSMFDLSESSKMPLTTTEARQAPLKLVAALRWPEVEGSSGGVGKQTAHGVLYSDDGESLEIGRSHCNFLRFELEVGPGEAPGQRAAALSIISSAPSEIEVVENSESCEGFEAPKLLKVKVLGWQRPVEGDKVRLEWAPGSGAAPKIFDIPVHSASSGSSHFEFMMPDGALELKYPTELRFTWTSVSDASAVLGGLGQGAAVATA